MDVDATVILASHLIAAKLKVPNGADNGIMSIIEQADDDLDRSLETAADHAIRRSLKARYEIRTRLLCFLFEPIPAQVFSGRNFLAIELSTRHFIYFELRLPEGPTFQGISLSLLDIPNPEVTICSPKSVQAYKKGLGPILAVFRQEPFGKGLVRSGSSGNSGRRVRAGQLVVLAIVIRSWRSSTGRAPHL